MRSPYLLPRVLTLLLFSIMVSGCATDGNLTRWGQCALIGGGTGGVLGAAIDGSSAIVGGLAGGVLIGGLICALTSRDSDGDGVANRDDLCPDTPAGVAIGESGCPIDSDNDGVPDYQVLCPDTPAGVTVNEHGCPDSDGDGVADNADKCLNTPVGAEIDSRGCPLDSDHDGVPDGLDRCPDTIEAAPVDTRGCYLKVSENLGAIHFRFDEEGLNQDSKDLLDKIVVKMRQKPDLNIKVYGYTDDSGQPVYNVGLSQRRADSVKSYLVEHGIAGDRIEALSGGVILQGNETRAGRADNRKVSLYSE